MAKFERGLNNESCGAAGFIVAGLHKMREKFGQSAERNFLLLGFLFVNFFKGIFEEKTS